MRELESLQAYSEARVLSLPGCGRKGAPGKGIERAIRDKLTRAFDSGKLQNSPEHILKCVRCFRERDMDPRLVRELSTLQLLREAFVVSGGTKNQARLRDVEHFVRDDGAWFDFSIIGREEGGRIELLAYDFELRLPPGHGAPFVRFDLNLPEHNNAQRSLRCHMHCGSDDFLAPAPLMGPEELLSLFIDGFREQGSGRKARRFSEYEIDWLKRTLDGALQ